MTSHETRSGSDTPETKTWAFDRSCTEKLSEALIFAQIFVTTEDGIGLSYAPNTSPDELFEGVETGVYVANVEGDGRFWPAEAAQGGVLSIVRSNGDGGAGWFMLLEDDRPLYHILEPGADAGALPRDVARLIVVGSCDLSGLADMDSLEALSIFGAMKLEGISMVFNLPALAELRLDSCLRGRPEGMVTDSERELRVSVSEQVPWHGDLQDLLEEDDD